MLVEACIDATHAAASGAVTCSTAQALVATTHAVMELLHMAQVCVVVGMTAFEFRSITRMAFLTLISSDYGVFCQDSKTI